MKGVTVPDIGCKVGFYSLELKRLGADYIFGSITVRGSSPRKGMAPPPSSYFLTQYCLLT